MANQEPFIVVRGRTDAKYWNVVETGRGVVVRWRRLIGNLQVEFGGRLSATLSANATFATLPKEAMVDVAETFIEVRRYTSASGSSAAGRLMVLRTDGRIMNTTGLPVSSGQYLFGSVTSSFTKDK